MTIQKRVIYPVPGKAPVYVPRRLIDAGKRPPRSKEIDYDTETGRPVRRRFHNAP